jgi:hypothetical protein
MKKLAFIAALFICGLTALPCCAESISANDVSANTIKYWLSENYGCKIDDDGDVIVKAKNSTIVIQIIPKIKAIRLFSSYSPYDKRSRKEMIDLANKFNESKRFMRIAITENASSVCDYYIIYDGGLDFENLRKVVEWFVLMDEAWCDFVINGGDK